MMYYAKHNTHLAADEPTDKSTVIWRYTNFTKFLSLIDRKGLYFPSLATLKQVDPFEGVWSVGHWKPMIAAAADKEKVLKLKKQIEPVIEATNRDMYVNCWHISSYESQAMWKLYGNEIVLKSTVKRLSECFVQRSKYSNPVYIGKVKYINYEQDQMNDDQDYNLLYVPFRKNRSYEHERELRAVLANPYDTKILQRIERMLLTKKDRGGAIVVPPPSKGVEIPIKPETLIEAVYLSPQTEEWYRDLVASIIRKYRLNIPVYKSTVNVVPEL